MVLGGKNLSEWAPSERPKSSSPWSSTHEWKGYNCFASALGALLDTRGLPCVSCVVDSGLDFYWAGAASALADPVGVYPGTVHPRILAAVRSVYAGARVEVFEHPGEGAFWGAISEGAPLMVALCNLACGHIPRRDVLPATCHYVLVEGVNGDDVRIHDPFLGRRALMPRARFVDASVFRTFDGEEVSLRTADVHGAGADAERNARERALAAFAQPPGEWPEPARAV